MAPARASQVALAVFGGGPLLKGGITKPVTVAHVAGAGISNEFESTESELLVNVICASGTSETSATSKLVKVTTPDTAATVVVPVRVKAELLAEATALPLVKLPY